MENMVGKKFGRLTAIEEVGRDAHRSRLWHCRCECGNEVTVSTARLNIGAVRSCGCIRRERPNGMRHGATAMAGRVHSNPIWRTYVTWQHMRARCDDPKNKDYRYYGGRGIKYNERWVVFEEFLNDMGERPEGTTLDRIDNNDHYYKENCRWLAKEEQSRNRREGIVIFYDGRRQTVGQWAKELGLKPTTIHQRLNRKWPVERVLSGGTFHKSGKFTPAAGLK